MFIFVGTRNIVKINAVEMAFRQFYPSTAIDVVGLNVSSEVPDQPMHLQDVIDGAINRAKNALKASKEKYGDLWETNAEKFGVGIEAGLVETPHTLSGFMDFQYCAIIDKDNLMSLGAGPGWEYPTEVIKSLKDNPKLEIGDIMVEISGNKEIKQTHGAIGYYSKDLMTRPEITAVSVKMALIPIINREVYYKI